MCILIASFLSSLARTRAGIADAIVACDAVDILCNRLFHPTSNEVKYSCAVALAYLTYNRTASRLLLHNCRNAPELYSTLIAQLKFGNTQEPNKQNYRSMYNLLITCYVCRFKNK